MDTPGNDAPNPNLAPNEGTPPAKDTPTDWRTALPEDVRDLPEIKKYKNVGELAKGHVNQSKLVGNSIRVPAEDAKPEEWDAFYAKLGRPESADKYEIQAPDDIKHLINEERIKAFREFAFKEGFSQKQVASLLKWQAGNIQADLAGMSHSYAETVKALKEEWGGAYDRNVGLAMRLVREQGGKDLMEYLDKTGLGNHPALVKFAAKVGNLLAEDGVISGDFEGMAGPQQAKEQIAEIMGDKNHAYWNAADPGHKQALDRVKALHELAYPNE